MSKSLDTATTRVTFVGGGEVFMNLRLFIGVQKGHVIFGLALTF